MRWGWVVPVVFVGTAITIAGACTGDDPAVILTPEPPDGSTSGEPDGSTTNDASDGSTSREAGAKCTPACDGAKPICVDGVCSSCVPLTKGCIGETPRTCDALG